jgi:hypothetical protein
LTRKPFCRRICCDVDPDEIGQPRQECIVPADSALPRT